MKKILIASLAAVFGSVILPTAAPQQSTTLKTFREGVFTAEQASRGEQIYARTCSMCHGNNLQGVEMAPPLAGATFRQGWDSQPLLTLANRIKTTMPPFAPNSLSGNQVTDLLSYILKANDLAAGNVSLTLPITDSTPATAASGPRRPRRGGGGTRSADLSLIHI